MRILLVAPMPPSATAALAIPRVLHAQLEGLGGRHEVTLAVVAGPEEPELEAVERLRASGVDVHAVCRREPRSAAERWARRRRLAAGWLGRPWPWRTVWYHDAGLQRTIEQLLAERRFDVVGVEDNAAAVYRFGPDVPVVFTEHEVRRPRPVRLRPQARALAGELDWRRWPAYHRSTWPTFDLIQAFTERDAEAIRMLAPQVSERVRVNPFGVELPEPLPPAPADSRELLFSGNFTHPPNVDAALWLASEIMPRLRSLGAGARLTIVGPATPESVKAVAAGDIRVTGWVPELTPYLASAAVVLAPLRIGGGMRMKVLESLALARAVVTTTRGAEGFEPGRDSAYVTADSADEIAAAAARLLGDAEARAALGGRARALAVEGYSAPAYGRRLEAVYEEAIELRQAHPSS